MTANPMPPMIPMSGPTGSMQPQGPGRLKNVDPLRVLRTHVWWIVASVVIGSVIGVGVWGLLHVTMPRYSSKMQLRVDEILTDPRQILQRDSQTQQAVIEMRVMNEINRLKSEEILRATMERPEVRGTAWFQKYGNDPHDALERLMDDVIRVSPVTNTSLINVSATTFSQDDPRVIVDAMINVFMLRLNEEANTTTGDMRQVYVVEGRRMEGVIDGLSQRLRQFTREHNITSTEAHFNEAQQFAAFYAQEIAKLETSLEQAIETHRLLVERQQAGDTTPSPEDIAAVNAMLEVSEIQRRLDQYREFLQGAVIKWGENSFRANDLRAQIAATEQELELKRQYKLRELQASRIESYATSISSIQAAIAALHEKLAQTKIQLTDLQQRLEEYRLIRDELEVAKQRKADNDEMMSNTRVWGERSDSRAVKRHTASTLPEMSFPKPEYVIPGVALLVVGLTTGLIFLFEMLDHRIKAPHDIKMVPDAELLGTLPDAAEDPSAPTGIERVVEKYPAGLMAEAFREVRTAIMTKMDRRGYKTLMLVAAQPRSGTSTVTQNLATSLAFHGRNVVIVDTNFRRPSQHALFDLSNDAGLVDALRGRRNVADCLQKVDGLSISVLATGPSADAPPELLEGSAFRSVISELESRFDVVLIDAPPALLTSDAQLLAKHVDAIVAVVRAVNDKRGMVERMTRRLGGQRGDLLGVILNGIQSAAGGYFRQTYREFYRYRDNGHDTGSIDRAPAPAKAR